MFNINKKTSVLWTVRKASRGVGDSGITRGSCVTLTVDVVFSMLISGIFVRRHRSLCKSADRLTTCLQTEWSGRVTLQYSPCSSSLYIHTFFPFQLSHPCTTAVTS